ncbi:unnamed protein product [Lupinus luteus]|uniref:Uncharacterized protein n=1 Tax=Lupinus luteus TaxID=3873 RepID=A0AAV1XKX0_LUPLU
MGLGKSEVGVKRGQKEEAKRVTTIDPNFLSLIDFLSTHCADQHGLSPNDQTLIHKKV